MRTRDKKKEVTCIKTSTSPITKQNTSTWHTCDRICAYLTSSCIRLQNLQLVLLLGFLLCGQTVWKNKQWGFFFLREQEGFDSLLVIYQIKQKSLHQVRNKEGKKQKHYKLCLDILQCEADTSFESIVTSGDVSNHSQFFFFKWTR